MRAVAPIDPLPSSQPLLIMVLLTTSSQCGWQGASLVKLCNGGRERGENERGGGREGERVLESLQSHEEAGFSAAQRVSCV